MISNALISSLQSARRPVFIWGAGMRAYATQALALARSLGIPVVCTWGAVDLIHHDDPLFGGGFGTHGTRAANFAVQNADLVIAIGSRLDTKATGTPHHFARAARIAMCDIDQAEIDKMAKVGRPIDFPICADAGAFIAALSGKECTVHCYEWRQQVRQWRFLYDNPVVDWPGINPYQLMKDIAQWTTPEDVIVSDTGCALGWLMQGFPFKGERFVHAFNMTPMGYGLPAAIGAAFATGRRVICVSGDGSIMMSLPELATIARWDLNIKIILLNNQGHAMCRQTQRQWLGGTYPSTSIDGGLGFPNFEYIAFANDISYEWHPDEGVDTMSRLFEDNKPAMVEFMIPPDAGLMPQAKYGQPLEDADPPLPREEFRAQMMIPTL